MEREPGAVADLPRAAPTRVDDGLREAATASRDRAELLVPAVVGALREAGPLLDPTPATRSRMRHRVLSSVPAAPAAPPATGHRSRRGRRLAAAAVGTLAVLGTLAATAGGTRPGEVGFPVRSALDAVVVDLSAVGGSRSGAELQVAGDRFDDLRAAVGESSGDPAAIAADLEAHLGAGSRAAVTAAVAGDVGQLVTLHDWAAERSGVLAGRAEAAGSPELRTVAGTVASVVARTDAIALRLSCREITDGSDELGPRPATSVCRPADPTAGGLPDPVVTPVAVDGLRTAR